MSDDREALVPLSPSRMADLERAVANYEASVSESAARYLIGRGIGHEEAKAHRLGVVADPAPGHERYRGMLCIPYLDRHGAPLTVRFRCIEDHDHDAYFHGKYMSLTDDDTRMYGVASIFSAKDVIHVTEGELDAVVLNKIGLNAVAIPGANNFKPRHRRMLAGFSRVWVWGDPDQAGAEFVVRLTKAMRQARSVPLKVGDVTETYLAGGAEALFALIKENS